MPRKDIKEIIMDYKNDSLNIEIENFKYFEIKEYDDHVELYIDNNLKFKVYRNSTVKTYDKSTIYAYKNSTIMAYDNSIVKAYSNSTVKAYGNSKIRAYDNSTVEAYGNSTVAAFDNSTVEAYGNSTVAAYDNSIVKAYNNSTAGAYSNSTVKAYNNSTVKVYDESTVKAYDSSIVIAFENSTVEAYDFSTVYKKSTKSIIKKDSVFVKIFEQVFKVPKKILVYKKLVNDRIAVLQLKRGQVFQSEFHKKCRTNKALVVAIESIDGKEKFNIGYSQYDETFVYKVGEVVSANYNENIKECSTGIHFFLNRDAAEIY